MCLFVLAAAAFPHYCTDPDVTLRNGRVFPSCELLGGFAIAARRARVSLLINFALAAKLIIKLDLTKLDLTQGERELSASALYSLYAWL